MEKCMVFCPYHADSRKSWSGEGPAGARPAGHPAWNRFLEKVNAFLDQHI